MPIITHIKFVMWNDAGVTFVLCCRAILTEECKITELGVRKRTYVVTAEDDGEKQKKRHLTRKSDALSIPEKLYNNSYFEAGRRPRNRSLLGSK